MEKLLTQLTFLILFLIPSISIANDFAGGSGTESDPFLVANAVHLDNVRLHLDAHFLQIRDISLDTLDFQEGMGWIPIGNCNDNFMGDRFTGTFDGNNFEISGLFINRSDNIPSGLFGCTQEARLLRIKLTEVAVSSGNLSGGLVGYNFVGDFNTIIQESSISGELSLGENGGGIIGRGHRVNIIDCSVEVNISGTLRIGGLAGHLTRAEVTNSTFSGSIQAGSFSGGAIGGIHTGNVDGVTVNANVIATHHFGGVVGSAIETNISSSSFYGELITTNVFARIGGIVEFMDSGTISNCTTEGYLEGLNAIGGIVANLNNSLMDNCHSTAVVVGQSQTGGLAGLASNCTITNSSFSGTIGLDKNGEEIRGIVVGGIVGSIQGGNDTTYISNSINFGSILGLNSIGGIAGVNTAPVKLTGVINEGNISASSVVGGIIGYPQDFYSIDETENRGNVEVQNDFAGGIIGGTFESGKVTNSLSSGKISGQNNIGGAFGIIDIRGTQLQLQNVHVIADVSGESNVGGLAGYAYFINASSVSAEGEVNGGSITGGLFGHLEFSTLEIAYFNGTINGRESAGGLLGYINQVEINNVYARGSILGAAGEVGGIAAVGINSDITNAYSTMDLGPENKNDIIFNNINSRINNSYFSSSTGMIPNPDQGSGVPLEQMTFPYFTEVYSNWDFNNIWRHDFTGEINDGLPFFRTSGDEDFYYVLLNANNFDWGSVTGAGYFDDEAPVNLIAVANDGFLFLHWEDKDGNIISQQENYQFSMPAENVYLTAIFEDPTSVTEFTDLNLKIYPNPTSDLLFINSEESISKVRLYSSTGKLIEQFNKNGNELVIPTAALPIGAYLIAIKKNNKWFFDNIQLVR